MADELAIASHREAGDDFSGPANQGERESVRELVARDPGLRKRKSLVLELACREFSERRARGETVKPSTYCEQFPVYRRSLQRMLDAYLYFHDEQQAEDKEQSLVWPEPDEQFLGFDLLENLGQGAFARVYLARQDAFGGRLVALKVARHRAFDEVQKLGRLPHPNIVPVYSLTLDPATRLTAVCMPYLGRATLCDLMDEAFCGRENPVSAEVIQRVAEDSAAPAGAASRGERISPRATYVEGVVQIVRQLAEALAYVHEAGVLHLDLKPSNVLLVPGGVPMLLDFNLSVALSAQLEGVGGTLPYMPPEFLRYLREERKDKAKLDDPRTDIFALGAIFYELLTGVLPFGNPERQLSDNEGAWQLLSAQAKGLPPASHRNRQIEPEIDRILARCLASEPADRYATMDELAADLAFYLSPSKRRARWRRRHRRTLLAAGAACVLAASAGGGWWGYRKATRLSDLDQGYVEYEQGDFAAALGCFDRHLARDPADAAGLFARAQTQRELGDWESAERDYVRASKQSEAGVIQAWCAYYLAKAGQIARAEFRSQAAISAGHDTAAVRNNLAFTQLQSNNLEQAEQNLDRAIALDGDLYAARHNRALLAVRTAFASGKPPNAQALQDADRALELGEQTTRLVADSAVLYGLAFKRNPALRSRAEELLERAIKLGLSIDQVRENPAFAELVHSPRIEELLEANLSAAPYTTANLLAEPPKGPRLADF